MEDKYPQFEIFSLKEVVFKGEWVLINAYFYKFWILRTEFDKYNLSIK